VSSFNYCGRNRRTVAALSFGGRFSVQICTLFDLPDSGVEQAAPKPMQEHCDGRERKKHRWSSITNR
jgi:hypothetical protein